MLVLCYNSNLPRKKKWEAASSQPSTSLQNFSTCECPFTVLSQVFTIQFDSIRREPREDIFKVKLFKIKRTSSFDEVPDTFAWSLNPPIRKE